jgi:hypothetical protein
MGTKVLEAIKRLNKTNIFPFIYFLPEIFVHHTILTLNTLVYSMYNISTSIPPKSGDVFRKVALFAVAWLSDTFTM